MTRRGKRSGKRCARTGCPGRSRRHPFCSATCAGIATALERGEAVCKAIGPGQVSTQFWLSLTTASDAWSEYLRTQALMQGIARNQGIDWRSLESNEGLTE